MPEYPDIQLYLHALRSRVLGRRLRALRVIGPNALRTVQPRPTEVEGRVVEHLERIGKRIVFGFDDDLHLVFHLMISGRLQWKSPATKPPARPAIAWLDFDDGRLVFTEASKRKRAGMWVVQGREALAALDPGGLEVIDAPLERFASALRQRNHTLKRALTDPTLFSGIGNAYSDEILHRARLSPFARTQQCTDAMIARLHAACRDVLLEWERRLIEQTGDAWPTKVTAFRPEMAVHGRFGAPCPACGAPVQRVVYADSEFAYCAGCQTEGRLLADRALSRLLREEWPRTLEELEEQQERRRQ